jgi:YHS domain-containing protein
MVSLLRLLFLVIASWLFLSVVWRLFRFSSLPRREKEENQEQVTALLVQDPQCGRFMAERDALQVSLRGHAVHFCSQECLALYTKDRVSQRPTHE